MLIDDSICENCLVKNHCDVLPYSNNCNEVRAMAKHDKKIYNKAIDDCIEELKKRRDTRYMKVNCDDVELKMLAKKLKGVKQNE